MTIASSFSRAAWGTLDKYTVIRRHLFTSSSAPAHKLLGYPAASGIAHLGGTAIVGGLAAYHSEPCVRPWLIGATAIFSAILGASIYSSEKIVDKAINTKLKNWCMVPGNEGRRVFDTIRFMEQINYFKPSKNG
jgi:hypothetical protein